MPNIRIDIVGDIISDDYERMYGYYGWAGTNPRKVKDALKNAAGRPVDVYINSGGGFVSMGAEIYTELAQYPGELKIYVTGQACSAASVIAMSRESYISPVAMLMVHCASSRATGNHNDMEQAAQMLNETDNAISNAYMNKTGMSREDVLALMEEETWLSADRAVELKLIDHIMELVPATTEFNSSAVASGFNHIPTKDALDRFNAEHNDVSDPNVQNALDICKARIRVQKIKGGVCNDEKRV